MIDPKLIDEVVKHFSSNKYDIVTNVHPRTYPKGLSVEAFKSDIFLKNFKKIQSKNKFKEHVSLFFYENSKKFKIHNLKFSQNLNHLNLSIDNINDLNFIRYIFKKNLNKLHWKKILNKLELI